MAGAASFTLLWIGVVLAWVVWGLPSAGPRLGPLLSAVLALASFGATAVGSFTPWGWLAVVSLAVAHLGRAFHGGVGAAPRNRPVSHPSVAGPGSADKPTAPPPQGSRRTLGRYRIVRELGRGAMGTVYLATDPQLGRRVAIKTLGLAREFNGDDLVDARARFRREAEAAARLQHPAIVSILAAGEADGLAFIAMEYLHGVDLVGATRSGALLPVATVLHIVEHVALALACAHAQGVIHRDVKPANVLFDAATGAVKVTDFGIASLGDTLRTRTGLWLGTPSYMSPEQMTGGRLDGRTDLYALGVMLFELLTGTLPHQAGSMAELLRQIAEDAAPDVRTRRPALPETLARIVAKALQKRPAMRYADGHRMAADLRAEAERLTWEPAPAAGSQVPNFDPRRES